MDSGRAALVPAVATLCLLLAGCGDSAIKTYKVAKEEKPALPAATAAENAPPGREAGLPHIHGTVPAGWVEQPPERMRAASFQIRGEGGKLAQMAIIPLPGTSGIETQSINMWREELGLPELSAEQFKTEAKSIAIGDGQGDFFEMTAQSNRAGEDFKRATLGAIRSRGGILWFAKMTGDAALVTGEKGNFQSYLKSLEFHEAGAHGSQAAASTPNARGAAMPASSDQPVSANAARIPADSSLPRWNPPAGWKEKAPGPMLTAAYAVASDAGQADVTISKLAGDGGGMVPNINRWRGQLGLAPAPDAEIQKSAEMIEVDGKKDVYLADLKGTNVRTGKAARMLAVGVPRGGQTWFYKLMGDEAVVEKEKDAFVNFIRAAY